MCDKLNSEMGITRLGSKIRWLNTVHNDELWRISVRIDLETLVYTVQIVYH